MRKAVAILAYIVLTVVAAANETSNEVLVPIVGRTPGAAGTFWQTDLFITNLTPDYYTLPVVVELFLNDGAERKTFTVDVPGNGTVTYRDVVREQFGRDDAVGILRVSSSNPQAQLAVRASIYNTGSSAGTFGQSVDALPIASLSRISFVGGLATTDGHRSNYGIANPNATPVKGIVYLLAPEGHAFTQYHVELAPFSVRQFPLRRGAVAIRAVFDEPVYAFGSVIREDTGDPAFHLPVAVKSSSAFELAPACTNPAEIFYYDETPAPGWIVVYQDGVNVVDETARLAARHGFTPGHVYDTVLFGFAAILTPQQIAALRCEASLKSIHQNAYAFVP